MTVTESEAMKKVCPMGQSHVDTTILCRGSACMAWRWAGPPVLVDYLSVRATEFGVSDPNSSGAYGGLQDFARMRMQFDAEVNARLEFVVIDIPENHKGGGWQKVGNVEIDEETGTHYVQRIERENDPGRTGYCGMTNPL